MRAWAAFSVSKNRKIFDFYWFLFTPSSLEIDQFWGPMNDVMGVWDGGPKKIDFGPPGGGLRPAWRGQKTPRKWCKIIKFRGILTLRAGWPPRGGPNNEGKGREKTPRKPEYGVRAPKSSFGGVLGGKNGPKMIENQWKMTQKWSKNEPKINEKWLKNQWKMSKNRWKMTQNEWKMGVKRLGENIGQKRVQKRSKNGVKMSKKWGKNELKMKEKWGKKWGKNEVKMR